MKHLYILLLCAVIPMRVFAANYTNKTSKILTLRKQKASDLIEILSDETVSFDNDQGQHVTIMSVDLIEILPGQTVSFDNDQGQSVTIMSVDLNENLFLLPTNNSFNYEITESSWSSKFSKLTIHSAQ